MQKGKLSSMTAILKKKTPESADARHVYFFGMGCGALWGEGSEGSRIMGGLHRTGRPCSHQWSDCAVSDGQTKGFKTVPLPLCHRQRIRESARGEMFSFFCVFSPMCSMCFVFFFFHGLALLSRLKSSLFHIVTFMMLFRGCCQLNMDVDTPLFGIVPFCWIEDV